MSIIGFLFTNPTQPYLLWSPHREVVCDQAELAAAAPGPQLILGRQSQAVLPSTGQIHDPDPGRRNDLTVHDTHQAWLWHYHEARSSHTHTHIQH